MEEKQLNINQPLLSVRRFSSIAASQRNERRKHESFLPTMPPIEPYKTELKTEPMRNPGNVPFVWEHSPGRPKNETNKQIQSKENPPSIPKLPPGRILMPKKKDSDKTPEEKNVKEGPTKKESSDSDENDETYMDALDTLSRGESFFYNCSASGVSGLESSDVKPSGIFSADPKVRDFMMGRFLPAAKAMASKAPQHTSRKYVVKDQPREVKKLANMDNNKKVQVRYGPNFLLDDGHDDEEDDNEYEYNENGNMSSKLCGLIPRFCLKGSFGLVNPVLGLSMRTTVPMSPANRTHACSSSASSFSETENEPARIAIYEHRSFGRSYLAKHQEETTNQNNSPKLEGLRTYPSESPRSYVSEPNSLSSQKETDKQGLMVEKTLYVDTIHTVKSPQSFHISCESFESDMFDDESKQETYKGLWKDPEVDVDVVDDMNDDQHLKASRGFVLELPAPPPLPKSPSDSWLWRTLPSMSSKNAPMKWNNRYPSSNSFSNDTKSDTSVQLRYSQGPLHPIPET